VILCRSKNDLKGGLRMDAQQVTDERSRHTNTLAQSAFGNPNVSQIRDHEISGGLNHRSTIDVSDNIPWQRRILSICRRPWPLIARVPIVAGVLIFAVSIAISHTLLSIVAHEQEVGVRRLAAVYLDGISTTVYPHVAAHNLANTIEALHRTMWFHQSMREQRALVQLPDGTLFADVVEQPDDIRKDDPYHDPALRQRLEEGGGFVFDETTGTGWAERRIVRDDRYISDGGTADAAA
jgi:hypothetical protein